MDFQTCDGEWASDVDDSDILAKARAAYPEAFGEAASDGIEDTLEDEVDYGVRGTGLVVSETGELVIVHADGGMDNWNAYRLNDVEAGALADMIRTVLG